MRNAFRNDQESVKHTIPENTSAVPAIHTLVKLPLLALVLCISALAQTPKTVELPLINCDGLLCIDANTGSGQALRLLLDLGARNTYLDSKTAQRLGLTPAGDSPVEQTTVAGLRLGDLPMGDFPFMVLDTTPDPSAPFKKVKSKPLPADGALTFGALQNRMLQIDFRRRIARISEPLKEAVPCPKTCSNIITKHFGQYGPVTLTVEGFEINGQQLDAQIDTLFTGTLLIYPAAADRLGMKKLSKSKQKEAFPYTQDGLQLARAEGVTLGFRGSTYYRMRRRTSGRKRMRRRPPRSSTPPSEQVCYAMPS